MHEDMHCQLFVLPEGTSQVQDRKEQDKGDCNFVVVLTPRPEHGSLHLAQLMIELNHQN